MVLVRATIDDKKNATKKEDKRKWLELIVDNASSIIREFVLISIYWMMKTLEEELV